MSAQSYTPIKKTTTTTQWWNIILRDILKIKIKNTWVLSSRFGRGGSWKLSTSFWYETNCSHQGGTLYSLLKALLEEEPMKNLLESVLFNSLSFRFSFRGNVSWFVNEEIMMQGLSSSSSIELLLQFYWVEK